MDNSPQNPPMPTTTKKATKRRKRPFRIKGFDNTTSMRQPNQIGMIYASVDVPDNPAPSRANRQIARIATQEEENRLKARGPSTSVRFGGMQFIW